MGRQPRFVRRPRPFGGPVHSDQGIDSKNVDARAFWSPVPSPVKIEPCRVKSRRDALIYRLFYCMGQLSFFAIEFCPRLTNEPLTNDRDMISIIDYDMAQPALGGKRHSSVWACRRIIRGPEPIVESDVIRLPRGGRVPGPVATLRQRQLDRRPRTSARQARSWVSASVAAAFRHRL